MQMPGMGLTQGPGLQLMHGIASRVEVMVAGDLRQFGRMAAPLTLVLFSPAEELGLGSQLAGCIGGQRQRGAHGRGEWGHEGKASDGCSSSLAHLVAIATKLEEASQLLRARGQPAIEAPIR